LLFFIKGVNNYGPDCIWADEGQGDVIFSEEVVTKYRGVQGEMHEGQ
jgi:hypothetical protein